MVDYRVRSVSLLNLVKDIQNGLLIPDAYFQRNLVWRDIHNKDFIKTILLGFPFPQIFISKGKVDVEKMSTISCIVDGQQRTNAIIKYLENDYDVDGKYYSDLTDEQKSNFLKYEIAVIELDILNDDPKVQQIFQRINRTSNSLSTIEKMASEYATSDFMLVAKLLTAQIDIEFDSSDINYKEAPGVPSEFFSWARQKKVKKFQQLLTEKKIYTSRELARKVHLQHILNIMSILISDFFTRNEKTMEFLNDYDTHFEEKDEIVDKLEHVASFILSLKLTSKSYWMNKSNIFSLIIAFGNRIDEIASFNLELLKNNLIQFENNIPGDYKIAASENVNNKKERELRDSYINSLLDASK